MTHPPTPEQSTILDEARTPCIEWDGPRLAKGYGFLGKDGKKYLAHRWIWESEHGPIPKGMCVCHRCDNPPCCNIEHLFLGTYKQNIADMFSKGRNPPRVGQNNGRAVLSENDVREIHTFLLAGAKPKELAQTYLVSADNIRSIKSGFSWKHIYKEIFNDTHG